MRLKTGNFVVVDYLSTQPATIGKITSVGFQVIHAVVLGGKKALFSARRERRRYYSINDRKSWIAT